MDKRPRILVVDDNPHVRRALAAFLTTLSWCREVCESSNGMDALEKVKNQVPDLVLMDVQMPAMDGLEATRIIKKSWPAIKVVILTIYAEYRSQAQQAGADAFLVKGCSMDEMSSTIRSLHWPLV